MEQTKDSKSCCSTENSNNNIQIKQSSNVSDPEIWNKVCPVTGDELIVMPEQLNIKARQSGFAVKNVLRNLRKNLKSI